MLITRLALRQWRRLSTCSGNSVSRRELRDKIHRSLQQGEKTVTEIQCDVGKKYSKKEIAATLTTLSKAGQVVKRSFDHTDTYGLN